MTDGSKPPFAAKWWKMEPDSPSPKEAVEGDPEAYLGDQYGNPLTEAEKYLLARLEEIYDAINGG